MRRRLKLDRLAQLLAASPLSQNHWALKLGLSRGHWSDIVNGRHLCPSARTRQRMVEVFGVSEDDLFADDDSRSPDIEFRLAIATRYELTEEVGSGGMGTVYLANDRRLNRLVAVKAVSPEATAGIGADQLLQEISHVARLHHPNILPLFDAGARAEHPFYVMPYVRGGSLGALLRRQTRLPLSQALPFIDGVSRGLSHAHAHHVLHCDVKPENVLLDGDHAWVMDFGIARKLHHEASEWSTLREGLDYSAGTPAYVSPEQAAGDRDLDQRSDVYSLACVAYEMLAGRPPFTGRTTQEIVTLRFRAPPPPLRDYAPEIPRGTVQVIARGMAIDPADRPASAGAFAAELRASASGSSDVRASIAVGATRALTSVRAKLGLHGPPRLALPMVGIVSDIRCVTRSLRLGWRFALGVILSLGLGVGMGIPTLSLADHLFLRPPPGVEHPNRVARLVQAGVMRDGRGYWTDGLTGIDYVTLREKPTPFEDIGAFISLSMSLGRGPDARPVNVQGATASFFSTLGVRPYRGRFYDETEDVSGNPAAPAVVSYRYWQASLGGADDVLGRPLRIGSVNYTVVGVAPPAFNGLGIHAVDAWVPLRVITPDFQGTDPQLWTTDRSSWLRIIARLRPGASPADVAPDLDRLYRSVGARTRDPDWRGSWALDPLQPGRSSLPSTTTRIALWLSAGGALLLVLIAANLTNLFLARNAANAKQVAVRLAIGGGRRRLFRLHLLESLVLGTFAALLGLAVSAPAIQAVRALLYPSTSWVRPPLDLRIAAVALALTTIVGGAVALWSTIQSARVDPGDLLRGGGATRGTSAVRPALRQALFVAQAAIFALLLGTATAFVTSARRASAVDLGFDADSVFTATVPMTTAGYSMSQARAFYRDARERLATLPDVAAAGLGYTEPWMNNRFEQVAVPGRAGEPPYLFFDAVTPEYARTVGLMVREGRWIDSTDLPGGDPVVVLNAAAAHELWPSEHVVGRCVRVGADSLPCRTIVGVIADMRFTGGISGAAPAAVYVPLAQADGYSFIPRVFIRPRGDMRQAMTAVRTAMQRMAPDLPVVTVRRVSENVRGLTTTVRVGAALFTAFGALAGVVAAVGLFSVLSFLVVERRREYAIRIALGAPGTQVVSPVIRQATSNVAIGVIVGLGGMLALRQVLEPMLFQTRLIEPAVLAVVAALALSISVAAALVPVRQVLRTDAMAVLRDQ